MTLQSESTPLLRTGSAAKQSTRVALARNLFGGRVISTFVGAPNAVALTFDDGPDPERTPAVLDVLAQYGVPATFFVIGEPATRHPHLLKRMAREGHAIGNHSYSHARCSGLSMPDLLRELLLAERAIQKACGLTYIPMFRPPYGSLRRWQTALLLACGRRIVFWSHDPKDFLPEPEPRLSSAAEIISGGDVVLLHDPCTNPKSLGRLLERLRGRGLTPVTLEDPFARNVPAHASVLAEGTSLLSSRGEP